MARRDADRRCRRCTEIKAERDFRPPAPYPSTGVCLTCRRQLGDLPVHKPDPAARLMQTLRTTHARPMTITECSMASVARMVSARDWQMHDPADDHDIRRRLMAALFANATHVLPSSTAALHVEGGVRIDLAWGNTADCVAHLLHAIHRPRERQCGLVMITQAPIPLRFLDGVEQHAGIPLYVHHHSLG
ncbi:MAG: hypothetical protein PF501_18930 [Salinisphaera sp.]|jgi:hypothetical protein|nr:hypothetical protein [Salinisphaera sp.]